MKRRLAAWALALLALVSVLPPGAAAEPARFVVGELSQPLKAGETGEVTISLENNPGFNALQLSVEYDNAALVCEDAQLGALIEDLMAVVNPANGDLVTVGAASLRAATGDGVVVKLRFRATTDVDKLDLKLVDTELRDAQHNILPLEVKTADPAPSNPSGGGSTGTPQPSASPKPTDDPQPTDKPEPDPEPAAPVFTDLTGHWGKDFAEKAAQAGLFKGYEDNTFRPDEPVSRAQFVTVLWRLAGTPEEAGDTPFTDTADQYIDFQKAIAWGYRQGYVKGTSEETFSPESTLTRQEAMTILFRYSGSQSGMELMFTSVYDGQFQDSGDIAPWAKSAMYWGVYHELIQGTGGGMLSPLGSASRVQIAKIMTQYQGNIGKEDK